MNSNNIREQLLLSIVIPAFNEESRLPGTLFLLEEVNKKCAMEIIIVCDGCTDGTWNMAQQWRKRLPLRVIAYAKNMGKGYALRKGVLAASGQIIAYMDADGATPPSELLRLAAPIVSGDADIVLGSRKARGAVIKRQPLYRHLLGRLLSLVTRRILLLPYQDTQCGFKLFRRDCAWTLFKEMKCNGFEFDLEILYRAYKKDFNILEVGIVWENRAGSTVSPVRDGFKMLKTILLLKFTDLLRTNTGETAIFPLYPETNNVSPKSSKLL